MYEFDDIISKHCLSSSIKYSRYADDLTFSTNKKDVLFTLPEIVSKLIKDLFYDSLVINNQKTIFSSKAHNRHVTGITITNDNKLSLGRNRKRLISSMIHRYTLNNLAIDEIYKLHGLLSYAIHIDSSIRSQMVNKYGLETIENLLHLSQLTKT